MQGLGRWHFMEGLDERETSGNDEGPPHRVNDMGD
jgi:hypothetical protein